MTALTQAERDRLDPRVNIDRLELFLAQVPPHLRAVALNGFLADPEPDIGAVVGSTDPALARLLAQVWEDPMDTSGVTHTTPGDAHAP
jgi:hypothetical protein